MRESISRNGLQLPKILFDKNGDNSGVKPGENTSNTQSGHGANVAKADLANTLFSKYGVDAPTAIKVADATVNNEVANNATGDATTKK